MKTVGPDDKFRPIMACHGSTEDNNRACNGYLAREGDRNINVRMLVATSRMAAPRDVIAACELSGIILHANYPEVLAKLEGRK